ncbi:hypothetical protein VNO80_12054 [Phaseolus coccineus]|uniref:Uncharacterized protein n=1 Tax=Phaseolus coccineus TaxID=3886 RepID=A0AAN9NBA6_PHACN
MVQLLSFPLFFPLCFKCYHTVIKLPLPAHHPCHVTNSGHVFSVKSVLTDVSPISTSKLRRLGERISHLLSPSHGTLLLLALAVFYRTSSFFYFLFLIFW